MTTTEAQAPAGGEASATAVREAYGRMHDRICWLLVRHGRELSADGARMLQRAAFAAYVDSREDDSMRTGD